MPAAGAAAALVAAAVDLTHLVSLTLLLGATIFVAPFSSTPLFHD
jgi:hypothetical protein